MCVVPCLFHSSECSRKSIFPSPLSSCRALLHMHACKCRSAHRGTKGSTSEGLSTNLHMLITTVAALRFSCMAPRLVRDLSNACVAREEDERVGVFLR